MGTFVSSWAPILVGAVVVTAQGGCLRREPVTAPPPAAIAVAPKELPDAKTVLANMSRFLAGQQRFSVTADSEYDAVQPSGQKISFGEVRRMVVSRPDRFRVELERSDGVRDLLVYDGKLLTAYSAQKKVYAQQEVSGGVDAAVTHYVSDLGMRLPLALLLVSGVEEQLARRTTQVDYVEWTTLHGVPAHHIAGRADSVDYQLWVADDAEPRPLRVVLTYKDASGEPQFRAQLVDWSSAPEIDASTFGFTPPDGSRKTAFVKPRAAKTSGGKKTK